MNFRKAIAILITFLLLSAIHLYIYVQNVTLKYQLTDLKIKLSELNSRKRELKIKVAEKENLAVVEKIAREQLGMFYPEKIIYLLVTREGTSEPDAH
jgi:cell division protein FtsL